MTETKAAILLDAMGICQLIQFHIGSLRNILNASFEELNRKVPLNKEELLHVFKWFHHEECLLVSST